MTPPPQMEAPVFCKMSLLSVTTQPAGRPEPAECCAVPGEWLQVAHQTLQLREEKVQGWKGEVWRQRSNLLLLWEVYWEKHPKQLPKLPVNQSKADLQQEIPIKYLLLSCHTAAFLRLTCLSTQQYQFSNEKHPQNPSRMATPPHKTVASLCYPNLPPPLRPSAARRSHRLPPHVLLL